MNWRYNDSSWAGAPRSFGSAFLYLLGHLIYSGVAFVSIMAVAWGVEFAIHELNSIYPFDLDEAGLIHKIQVFALAADTFIVCIFVLAGIIRFIKDLRKLL
jgi:hypothetical protein